MVETETVINRSDLNSDIFFRETVKIQNTYVDYAKDNVTCLITGLYRFDKQTNEVLVNNFGDHAGEEDVRRGTAGNCCCSWKGWVWECV